MSIYASTTMLHSHVFITILWSNFRSPNTPVIGWPPVRAFRRNLATSSRASLEHQNGKKAAKPEQTTKRAPFVKINMDGIPIGRKIDLNALSSYDELSLSVDKLFRGLLAGTMNGPLLFSCSCYLYFVTTFPLYLTRKKIKLFSVLSNL